MPDHRGRVAVVTGSAQGIGQAVATRLAQDGYDIGLVDLNEQGLQETTRLVREHGRRALPLRLDITDSAAVASGIDQAASALGGLHTLVCCAGLLRDASFLEMTDDQWSASIAVNLTGTFFCTRTAARIMARSGGGRIVLVSSTSAQGNPDQANYSAAKAGVEGLTKALSLELGPLNINVNAVAPGFTVTQMTRDLARKRGMSFEQLVDSAVANIPLRRVAQASDMANVIAFLAGDDASFVSGQILYATGGSRGSTARTPAAAAAPDSQQEGQPLAPHQNEGAVQS